MFGKTSEGSTGRLVQLCVGYFLFYVATGLIVKFFTGSVDGAAPRMDDMAFGIVAFFSVFIFMFKGRTATFTGLVNRLTSLVAGTTATLLGWVFFGSKFPTLQNWVSLGFVLVAVAFLTRAERKRAEELKAAKEI